MHDRGGLQCVPGALVAHVARCNPTQIVVDQGAVGASWRRATGAAQHGPHPADQLLGAERFHHIVVGPHLQPGDPVLLLAAGGEHDDGGIAPLAKPACDLQAADAWQHEVEHHQVGQLGRQALQSRVPVRDHAHLVGFPLGHLKVGVPRAGLRLEARVEAVLSGVPANEQLDVGLLLAVRVQDKDGQLAGIPIARAAPIHDLIVRCWRGRDRRRGCGWSRRSPGRRRRGRAPWGRRR